MNGSFMATFSGTKSEISLLAAFMEEAYPELIKIVMYPDDFDTLADDCKTQIVFDGDGYINERMTDVYEQMCSAAPALDMEAYISQDRDGNSMNKYISAAGSAEVIEIEGVHCAKCGEFISYGDIDKCNEFDEPVCENCCDNEDEDDDTEINDFLSALFGTQDNRMSEVMELLENGEYQQAYDLTKEYAEKDDSTAAYNMAIYELNGLPTGKPNYSAAEEWMSKAAELGDEDAMDFLNVAGGIGENYVGALNGNADEMGKFAAKLLQVEGKRVQGNFSDNAKIAFDWAEKSTELGSTDGLYALGLAYEFGTGTEEDTDKALDFYKKSAELKNDLALIRLAFIYMKGIIVNRDYELALEYMKQASDLGNTTATKNMAILYFRDSEYEEAIKYYSKVEDMLDESEMRHFAYCYESVEGIESENTKQHYIKAMDMGDFGAALVVKDNYTDIDTTDNPFSFLDERLDSEDEDEEYEDEETDIDDTECEMPSYEIMASAGWIIVFKKEMVSIGKATVDDDAFSLVRRLAAEGNEQAQALLEDVDIVERAGLEIKNDYTVWQK